jgi:hypothetical protein
MTETSPSRSTSQPTTVPDGGPLAGPAVVEGNEKPRATLVERGIDGRVKMLESTPEEAAVEKLDLSDEERKAVNAVFARRAAKLDAFVMDNIDLLTKFGQAEGTGDKGDQIKLLLEAAGKLEWMWKNGPLEKQVRAALPIERRGEFDRLLTEFWAAIVADRKSITKEDGTKPNKVEVTLGVKLENVGKEIERAAERTFGSGELIYRKAMEGIELEPEQSEKIRPIWSDFWERTKGEATEPQNVALVFKILPILTEPQRARFIKNLKGF